MKWKRNLVRCQKCVVDSIGALDKCSLIYIVLLISLKGRVDDDGVIAANERKMDQLYYLELCNDPTRFDSVSQLTTVFFDDSNKQVMVMVLCKLNGQFGKLMVLILADSCLPFDRVVQLESLWKGRLKMTHSHFVWKTRVRCDRLNFRPTKNCWPFSERKRASNLLHLWTINRT